MKPSESQEVNPSPETPMMGQYRERKAELPEDVLLLFRLGDFYELFGEDAKEGANLLGLALTHRQGTPMCGMPAESVEGYIARLVQAGKRVAVCEQVEVPRPGKLVRREITRVITPGSLLDPGSLRSKENNFCLALVSGRDRLGVAALDLGTGEFRAGELQGEGELADLLCRLRPSEILLPGEEAEPRLFRGGNERLEEFLGKWGKPALTRHRKWAFTPEHASALLLAHFGTKSLAGFGLAGVPLALSAAGGLFHYLREELRQDLSHVQDIAPICRDDLLVVDAVAQRTLELLSAPSHGKSFLEAIDRTLTPGGGRLLRQWISEPLRDRARIHARQDAVAYWAERDRSRRALRELLPNIRDLERLLARVAQGSVSPREVGAIKDSLKPLPQIRALLPSLEEGEQRRSELEPQDDLVAEIERALVSDLPPSCREGGLFRVGFDAALDALREAAENGKKWLLEFERSERERTGLRSLKLRYHPVFGYLLEVPRGQLPNVPAEYVRRQTLANAERFTRPELQEMEQKILGAEGRARELELELFRVLRQKLCDRLPALQKVARALNEIDVVAGLAELARERGYVRPEMVEEPVVEIVDGRHPVVEQSLVGERFVPNDTYLDGLRSRLAILTGPNMAGKSTYLRQIALICLLAHAGSFVPATRAKIGILDRIFTRIGASDDLANGQSTFLVEMQETANLLRHATERSLVILDEVGRGTSTFDGLSIAWAVAEELCDRNRCLTLFATHFHELAELAQSRSAVRNLSLAVREIDGEAVYLRKVVEGVIDKSYGLQVARLAGLPERTIRRAAEVLSGMEAEEEDPQSKAMRVRRRRNEAEELPLFPDWQRSKGQEKTDGSAS
ncbi:DNA mismatch repair protein MutS [Methylacidimicrobium cyclopophantes]|uniref:DNA mismatch repair protein MutS n=1 Tax=Methylacidimicrobium cyclopophantes TaxID=1041766 RepID=A0A5E6MQR6_9BACT|nr:DNA mismatch repair protein MutS [Methylacidimicrobium cyclopophantes]VVM08056.1 DNA mismatch repair protein MutS [Methylacidimicrobium cyclopophantes]